MSSQVDLSDYFAECNITIFNGNDSSELRNIL